jgi:hypothetical protein
MAAVKMQSKIQHISRKFEQLKKEIGGEVHVLSAHTYWLDRQEQKTQKKKRHEGLCTKLRRPLFPIFENEHTPHLFLFPVPCSTAVQMPRKPKQHHVIATVQQLFFFSVS